jgi:DNA adenine methylase
MKTKTGKQRITSPLKWHGGKHYLASKIVAMMPPHTHYVEPYAGGLSVLLAKEYEGVSEVVNDVDGELTNFWRTLSRPVGLEQMSRILESTPFSEWHYRNADEETSSLYQSSFGPDATRASNFFVRCRQSLAGRMDAFAAITKNRVRRGMNEQTSAWLSAVEGLPEVHARLRRVLILNRDALDVIRNQDGPNTLFYLDPPYLPSTRVSPSVYRFEMTTEQHVDLCTVIRKCKGKVILSGYPSELYRVQLEEEGWKRTDFKLPNNAASGEKKRVMTESVWCNFS